MRIINTAIIGQPLNWVRVPLMAAFGMLAIYLICQLVANNSPTGEQANG